MEGKGFAEGAARYARNPLGIIALFIVFVYLIAGVVLGQGATLSEADRRPLVWFLSLFPVAVLGVFSVLVMFFHENLYSPQDLGRKGFMELARRRRRAADFGVKAIETQRRKDRDFARRIDLGSVREAIFHAATPQAVEVASRSRVLWVDDHPTNNFYERESMRALGIDFELALTTEEALEILGVVPVDVVLSDMMRDNEPDGKLAGYKLLDALRSRGLQTPVVFYVGDTTDEFRAAAIQRGALGQTNRPDELVELVLSALAR